MKKIEVEDWVYDGLMERCRVLGYESINDLLIDEVLRRAVPLVYRKKVAEFMWNKLLGLKVGEDELIDAVIEKVIFEAIDKYGHLVSSVDLLSGTAFELLVLKAIHENTDLDYVYKGVQVGLGLKRGSIDLKDVFGMPDIVVGRNGKISTIIEAKKQTTFRVDETDKFKLAYFASKGHNVILVSTASPPKKSQVFEELVHKGVIIAFVRSYGDLLKLSREISVG
jgi:hypothetical protein